MGRIQLRWFVTATMQLTRPPAGVESGLNAASHVISMCIFLVAESLAGLQPSLAVYNNEGLCHQVD